ncbi:hypothetical protein SAMN04489713_13511 [Actinomadura madurae]|uniref:Uncharacterized protein n=1 Tax=Actinomadura madurae TaxID=1993 RepID=A0A1I5YMT1_9ACTN|nr:hypothetical protein SAMN04489713_13511 [Actinomadura madurae]
MSVMSILREIAIRAAGPPHGIQLRIGQMTPSSMAMISGLTPTRR